MKLAMCWQGSYGPNMSSEQQDATSPLQWTPVPDRSYLVMVQTTISTDDGDYTSGIVYGMCTSNGTAIPFPNANPPLTPPPPNPNGVSISQVKSSAGGPSVTPLTFIRFDCPTGWDAGPVFITVSKYGHNPKLGSQDFVSIAVAEIEQADQL